MKIAKYSEKKPMHNFGVHHLKSTPAQFSMFVYNNNSKNDVLWQISLIQ
jgi:hypothetical protein